MAYKDSFTHEPADEPKEEMRSRYSYSAKKNRQNGTFRKITETWNDIGNKSVDNDFSALECDCISEHPEHIVRIGNKLYCQRCAPYCPACGKRALPGQRERWGNDWYHKKCGAFERTKYFIMQRLEADLQMERTKQAHHQNDLTKAQVCSIHATIKGHRAQLRMERQRLLLQKAEAAHRMNHEARQLDLQEQQQQHRIFIESSQLELQSFEAQHRRLMESSQMELQTRQQAHAFKMDHLNLALRTCELNSQLQSQEQERTINKERHRMDIVERLKKLEQMSFAPQGTTPKALP